MNCSFISDLHLDGTTSTRNEPFALFLRHESRCCDELYLLGDLTEVWVGDDDESPFIDFLRHQLWMASRDCRIRLMHGNRDFLLGAGFARSCGVELITDPCVIERNGKRLLLCHGDSLCTHDVAYQRARALLRSRSWHEEVLAKPLAERRGLAAALREQSRANNANKPTNIMDVTPEAVTDALREHSADVIIHGHTHRPAVQRNIYGAGTGTRIVLGDWDRCGWVLRFDGEFTLQRFALALRSAT